MIQMVDGASSYQKIEHAALMSQHQSFFIKVLHESMKRCIFTAFKRSDPMTYPVKCSPNLE